MFRCVLAAMCAVHRDGAKQSLRRLALELTATPKPPASGRTGAMSLGWQPFFLQNLFRLRGRPRLSMSKRLFDGIDYIPRVAGFSLNDSKCLTKCELGM
jgi:hypothetical protein